MENKVNSDSGGSRDRKIKRIQEIISDKTLSFGCKIFTKERGKIVYHTIIDITKQENGEYTCECGGYEVYDIRENNIIGHPVMIGDVLDWIPSVIYRNYNDIAKIIKIRDHKRKPLEEQSMETIDYLYSLLPNQP